VLSKVVGRSRIAGHLLGAALYPIESVLTQVLAESPTSKIAVAHRAAR
jgi:hypothetical protein